MKLEQSEYVLGHTNAEQLRLIRQARVLAPFTNRLFRDAGIASGMRVLDIGCGMGDVTMLAAQLVGPSGRVVSIDRDQASIETAPATSFSHWSGKRKILSGRPFDLRRCRVVRCDC